MIKEDKLCKENLEIKIFRGIKSKKSRKTSYEKRKLSERYFRGTKGTLVTLNS